MSKMRLGAVAALSAVLCTAAGFAVSAREGNSYVVTKLVSDQNGVAVNPPDASLVNGWGLTSLPTSPWWVADNGTNVSTLYRADGSKVALTVGVHNAPTGAVANTGTSFAVSSGTASVAARFIFATEEGAILAWNPAVSPDAVLAGGNTAGGAVYKGLAIASTASGDFLFATDFHNAVVDVFDGAFQPVQTAGGFVDPGIPAGYAPFGIQNVGGAIVVTYAKQDPETGDDIAGQGNGFVDLFDTSGVLLQRIAQHGQLNSPWGVAMAPDGFGAFSGDLLIGNFGDGQINAFALQPNGRYEHAGELRTPDHRILTIDGLWALQFGKGSPNNGPMTTLFFTAGPDDESHGLFGSMTAQ